MAMAVVICLEEEQNKHSQREMKHNNHWDNVQIYTSFSHISKNFHSSKETCTASTRK